MELHYILTDDIARPYKAHIVNAFHEEEDIRLMDWPSRPQDLDHIEHVWDGLRRALSQRSSLPRTPKN
ncbi:hypothetical protein TNCV_240191 [Trichonephila clavipes]|nr:hypothetical protein TNCV_240191 [Trichonephila clavipes]